MDNVMCKGTYRLSILLIYKLIVAGYIIYFARSKGTVYDKRHEQERVRKFNAPRVF